MDTEEAEALASNPPNQILTLTQPHRDQVHMHGDAHNPTPGFDAISGLDGDDLIFCDEAFASDLPDFRCLSSPSPTSAASQLQPPKSLPTTTSTPSSSSSSSSTPSSTWPFLRASDAGPRSLPGCSSETTMQPLQPSIPDPVADTDTQVYLNLLDTGGVDEFDLSAPWDSSELFPLTVDVSGACTDQPFNFDLPCPGIDETNNNSALEGGPKEEGGDDLAQFFLEWLKNNKDAISPEDLRSIRLKKSTIECAARRLGADRRGRMQLVKLILSWVQNHHLQRKKARLQEADQPHANANSDARLNHTPAFNQAVPVDSVQNSNPNVLNMDFDMGHTTSGCNSWFQPTNSYNFPPSCSANTSATGNSQLFSPVSELHATDPNMSWDQSYNTAFQNYPMTYQAGLQATQYNAAPVSPLYQQGQGVSSMESATKEARKKRMARQRRILSLQQSRALGQSDNPVQCGFVGQGSSGNRHWAFWSSLAMNHQQGTGMMDLTLLPGGSSCASQTKQTMQGSGQHVRSMLRPGVSTSERRQVLKSQDKNLRFLLQKVLKQSDVGSLGRIVLPKKEAEVHLPELDSRDGITLPMEDIGTSRIWNMRYRSILNLHFSETLFWM
ncbi:B3 domain-containing transcription factor ABI3 [Rhynchospora pubera]|uniref:B3 domain-containing transcription factor ABI3 n=1 Tax=Rhynchospora pubera TaxID=906938 RepID=A0AAV8EW66_9POAL|nr:B3 domain-containing transcription factor ABI3 [Rhynchospora pubera]